MIRLFCRCAIVAAGLVAAAAPSRADVLGAASGYNLFTFGNVSQSNGDVEGRAAVGGAGSFTGGFGINNKNTGDTASTPAFVVGGNLNWTAGQVFNGSAVVGGSVTGPLVTPNGTVTQNVGAGGLPIDFGSAYTDLAAKSQAWGNLAANGSATNSYGQLSLTGSDPTLNVFSLRGDQLSNLNNLSIAAPAGSTVLVDVKGNPAAFSNYGMNLNGVDRNHVLFNFVDATALTTNGFSFQGSILAPHASLLNQNGNIEGQVIVGSVAPNSTGEYHNYLFTGNLPGDPGGGNGSGGPKPVPGPSGLVLGLLGAGVLGVWRRRV